MKKLKVLLFTLTVILTISEFTVNIHAQCSQYNINWYKGYYSEDGIRPTFPLKTDIKKAVFSQVNNDDGEQMYMINLESTQLIDNVSRYNIVLFIPSVFFKANSEIKIEDSNLTEKTEGAVARFRYSIGVAKDGSNVGDNFWSNHDAGRNIVAGKILLSSISAEKISGTFSFKAFATGYGGGEDEQKERYVEISEGCFNAELKK